MTCICVLEYICQMSLLSLQINQTIYRYRVEFLSTVRHIYNHSQIYIQYFIKIQLSDIQQTPEDIRLIDLLNISCQIFKTILH